MKKQDLVNVARFLGVVYKKHYLSKVEEKKDTYAQDPLAGYYFMLGRAYMQGRRDSLSTSFFNNMKTCLDAFQDVREMRLEHIRESLPAMDAWWNDEGYCTSEIWMHMEQFVAENPDRRLGKLTDKQMAIDMLCHAARFQDCNVYAGIVRMITEGNMQEAHEELRSIRSIGPKIASFLLRDLALIHLGDMENLQGDDAMYLQPIDVHVANFVSMFDGRCSEKDDVARYIVDKMAEGSVYDACLINAGAWMYGFHGGHDFFAV